MRVWAAAWAHVRRARGRGRYLLEVEEGGRAGRGVREHAAELDAGEAA